MLVPTHTYADDYNIIIVAIIGVVYLSRCKVEELLVSRATAEETTGELSYFSKTLNGNKILIPLPSKESTRIAFSPTDIT